ncbi:amidase [Nocardia sp.]|uniref:amidase n=1 Tax=Nocardia sp. TaxID=1821 RepID=UPI0039C9CA4A
MLRTAGVAASATTLFGPSALSGPAPAAAVPRRSPVLPDPGSITATDPALLSALEAVSLLRSRALHPRELLDACLRRSAEHDGEINSWVHVYPETAHAQAEAAATRLAAGNAPLLCGLPVGVKDLYALEGLPLTADSRILEHNIASGDATVCRKLRDNGAILMGHARLDEFALLTATPQVGNPWNIADTVGGSSGGSAAVLAARFAPLALGTDTGGSVRLPASRCGISSIKPTYGRCSTYGIIPVMWTRDHPAPMGRSLADAALLLSFMAGPDGHDPATTAAPPPAPLYPLAPRPALKPLAGKVFGVVAVDMPAELGRLFGEYLALITELGGELRDVRLPAEPEVLATGGARELGSYHRQWLDRLTELRPSSLPVVGMGLAALAAPFTEYQAFERAREQYQRDYNRLFAEHGLDAVVLPGAARDGTPRATAAAMSLLDADLVPVAWANYTGAPAIALPAGRSAVTGMPFGVQLGGLPWAEADLLDIGLALEAAAPYWREEPPLRPSPRVLPAVAPQPPGPGPDPTNTETWNSVYRFFPTTATATG